MKRKYDEEEERRQSNSKLTLPSKSGHSAGARKEKFSAPNQSPREQAERSPSPLFVEQTDDIEIKVEGLGPREDVPLQLNDVDEVGDFFARGFEQASSVRDRQEREATQAIFRERSPTIDLEVAPPYEGWQDGEPQDNGERSPTIDFEIAPPYEAWSDDEQREESPELKQEPGANAGTSDALPSTIPETQAVFREQTPMLDLDLAEPDVGFDLLPSSLPLISNPGLEENAESVSSSSDWSAQLEVFVENAVGRGFPPEIATGVIMSTSLDTELAKKVLEFMQTEKRKSNGASDYELPEDWKGVWTSADDEAINATDGRQIEQLAKKHGKDSFRSRWEFLEFYATA